MQGTQHKKLENNARTKFLTFCCSDIAMSNLRRLIFVLIFALFSPLNRNFGIRFLWHFAYFCSVYVYLMFLKENAGCNWIVNLSNACV